MNNNYFNDLYKIDVNDRTKDKKAGNSTFTYLSWAWAWAEVKKRYPDANFEVHKYGEEKKPYLNDKKLGVMVSTSMTINDITHEMWLPVLNGANMAMKEDAYKYNTRYKKDNEVDAVSMFEINTAIMRCLVKNIGLHGLGLYIYAGEDIPTDFEEEERQNKQVEELEEKETKARNYVNKTMANLKKQLATEDNLVAYEHLGIDSNDFLERYKSNIISLQDFLQAKLNPQEEASKEVNVT